MACIDSGRSKSPGAMQSTAERLNLHPHFVRILGSDTVHLLHWKKGGFFAPLDRRSPASMLVRDSVLSA